MTPLLTRILDLIDNGYGIYFVGTTPRQSLCIRLTKQHGDGVIATEAIINRLELERAYLPQLIVDDTICRAANSIDRKTSEKRRP